MINYLFFGSDIQLPQPIVNTTGDFQLTLLAIDDIVTNMENNERIGGYEYESKKFQQPIN